MASKFPQKHEYHFVNRQILIFHAPAVQIYFFEKKSSKNNKFKKYVKKS
jgi:hypothetical protein